MCDIFQALLCYLYQTQFDLATVVSKFQHLQVLKRLGILNMLDSF